VGVEALLPQPDAEYALADERCDPVFGQLGARAARRESRPQSDLSVRLHDPLPRATEHQVTGNGAAIEARNNFATL
jgi:hypothetical protein